MRALGEVRMGDLVAAPARQRVGGEDRPAVLVQVPEDHPAEDQDGEDQPGEDRQAPEAEGVGEDVDAGKGQEAHQRRPDDPDHEHVEPPPGLGPEQKHDQDRDPGADEQVERIGDAADPERDEDEHHRTRRTPLAPLLHKA